LRATGVCTTLPSPSTSAPSDPTAAVRGTDNDAAVSRASATRLGYLHDPFAKHFVKSNEVRPPLINIGTHVRTWAIDQLVLSFLNSSSAPKQIISLGAGSDTRYFRLTEMLAEGSHAEWNLCRYVELDFAETTSKKAFTLRRNSLFSKCLGSDVKIDKGGTALRSPIYNLLPTDLKTFCQDVGPKILSDSEGKPVIELNLPTLIIAECVFIYLEPILTNSIIRWFSQKFSAAVIALYDPINFDDAFGRMMISNLRARRIELHSAHVNFSVSALKGNLEAAGFTHSKAEDVWMIRQKRIPKAELERVAKLELLDEIEELQLVLSHYAVAWGTNSMDLAGISLG